MIDRQDNECTGSKTGPQTRVRYPGPRTRCRGPLDRGRLDRRHVPRPVAVLGFDVDRPPALAPPVAQRSNPCLTPPTSGVLDGKH
jgi:hypothetical protein